MSRRARLWTLRALFLLVAPIAFMLLANAAQNITLSAQVERQVGELSALLLQRVERSVDYAVIAASELVEEGVEGCNESVAERVRSIVLAAGPVKDIQLLSERGEPICSGQALGAGMATNTAPYSDGVPARNASYAFHAVKGVRSTLLGIVWHSGATPDLAVLVDLNTLMFDIFPEWLRDQARAELLLGGDTIIARYEPESAVIERTDRAGLSFSVASNRFPLSVVISMPRTALEAGKMPMSPLLGIAGIIAGLLVASLSIRLFAPNPSPLVELDDAIRNGEIQPFFQPLASLGSGELTGVEVLARWVKPDGRVIPPDRFIPMAEENARSVALTLAIAEQALTHLAAMMAGHPTFKMAINIVPDDLLRDGFLEDIHRVIVQHGTSPAQIVLEMTERQPIADLKGAKERIALARSLGFRIAIDDAGAGHNGLSNIQALGAQILKIDKVFIDLLDVDHTANAIVELLVRLGNRLGMTIVAEGVESAQQTSRLRDLGVHEVQGYFVGRPMDAQGIQAFVRVWRGGHRRAPD